MRPINSIAAFLKLLGYELKILKQETVWGVLAGLFLVSLALIGGSRNSFPFVAWIFFENLAPLVMLFIAIALLANDRDHNTLESLFSRPGSGFVVYLRRLAFVHALDAAILLGLALLWQIETGTPPVVEILLTSVPPVVLLTNIGFFGAVLLNDSGGGPALGGSWWLLNQFLRRYGSQGWFGYIFLFKKTYYPHFPAFWSNRLALLLLGVILASAALLLLRKVERFL